MNSPLVNAILD
jgi:hypothetical protein